MKKLHLFIIAVICISLASLGYVAINYWNVYQHGTPIANVAGVNYQTYLMRHNFAQNGYVSLEYLAPLKGNNSIRISNPSSITLNDCVVTEDNNLNRTVLSDFQSIKKNFEFVFELTNASKDEISKISFSCKKPQFAMSWPILVLDKSDYSQGDTLALRGNLFPSSDLEMFVFEPVGASNLIHDGSPNPFLSTNINTDSVGNFSFSYRIPDDQANGKWVIGAKSGDNEYYLMFRVGMEPGSF